LEMHPVGVILDAALEPTLPLFDSLIRHERVRFSRTRVSCVLGVTAVAAPTLPASSCSFAPGVGRARTAIAVQALGSRPCRTP
jgi:hypothetical protein